MLLKRVSSQMALVAGALVMDISGCSTGDAPATQYTWQAVQSNLPGAVLSIWGTSDHDVYAVGGDSRDGSGPTAIHYNGTTWQQLPTGLNAGDLWWVFGPTPDMIFMVGSNATILAYQPGGNAFVRMPTPGTTETLFGVWGVSATDMWAVGGNISGTPTGVIYHYDGTAWTNVTLPTSIAGLTLYKVWGTAANDVWVVGDNGTTLHWDGASWTVVPVPSSTIGRLFTVHGSATQRYAVGGYASGIILQGDGHGGWMPSPMSTELTGAAPRLNGVYVPSGSNDPIAVGANGTVLLFRNGQWQSAARNAATEYDFHSVWVDPTGQVWAVGGQIASSPVTNGMIYHFGTTVPSPAITPDPSQNACPTTPGTICTWAGTGDAGFNDDGRPLRQSTLYWPIDTGFRGDGTAYILDWNNHRIRRVMPDDTLQTIVGTEIPGDGPPGNGDLVPPGVPGTTVSLNHPTQFFQEPTMGPWHGRMLMVAWHNHKIREWDPVTGNVTVLVGRGPGYTGDGMPIGPMTLLKDPSKAVIDPQGNLYFFDQANDVIREITTDMVIHTVVGTGTRAYTGDNGPPLMATLNVQGGENPEPEGGLAMDAQGRLYISDTDNNVIRRVDFTANTITTYAGTGTMGFAGDNGPAAMAQFNSPRDLAMSPDGTRLVVADTNNHRIRAIDLATGYVTTVAGTGIPSYAGDRGPAANAQLYRPFGVEFNAAGDLYVADTYNNRIRVVHH